MIKWMLAVPAALVIAVVAALGTYLWLALPADPQIVAGAVSAEVEVRYDAYRRPFVSARTRRDAYFAQGWLHGRERLWQMELLRRAGSGRLAQALGPDLLAADVQMWRAGVPLLAERLADNAGTKVREFVDAYVGGVNLAL